MYCALFLFLLFNRIGAFAPDAFPSKFLSKKERINIPDILITALYPSYQFSNFKCSFVDSVSNLNVYDNKKSTKDSVYVDKNISFYYLVLDFLENKKIPIDNSINDARFIVLEDENNKNYEKIDSSQLFKNFFVEFQVYTLNNFVDASLFCNNESRISNYYFIIFVIITLLFAIFYVRSLPIETSNFFVFKMKDEPYSNYITQEQLDKINIHSEFGKRLVDYFIDSVKRYNHTKYIPTYIDRTDKGITFNLLFGIPLPNNYIIVIPQKLEYKEHVSSSVKLNIVPELNSKIKIENQAHSFGNLSNDYLIKLEFDIVDKEHTLKFDNDFNECFYNKNSNVLSEASITKVNPETYHVKFSGSPFISLAFLPQSQLVLLLSKFMIKIFHIFSGNPFSKNCFHELLKNVMKDYSFELFFLFKERRKKHLHSQGRKHNTDIKIISQFHTSKFQDLDEAQARKIIDALESNDYKSKDKNVQRIIFRNDVIPGCEKFYVLRFQLRTNIYAVIPVNSKISPTLFDQYTIPETFSILIQLYHLSNVNKHITKNNRILSIFQGSQYFQFIEISGEENVTVRSNKKCVTTTKGDLLKTLSKVVPESDSEQFRSQIDELEKNHTPIFQRQVSFMDDNNNLRCGSICAVKKKNKQSGNPISLFFFEDTTEIQKKQINLYNAHRSFQIATNALGLHKFQIDKGNIILNDNSLFEEIHVTPPINRQLIDVIASDDKNKVNRPSYVKYLNLSSRRQTMARQSTLAMRRNKLTGFFRKEIEPHESPVSIPKENSTTLRLVDGNGSYVWYSLISDDKMGFIFSVDSTVKMRRQLQTTDRGLKIASASTLLFTFWGVDTTTDSVQQLLKYDTIWDILGVDQYTPFSKISELALVENENLERMVKSVREGTILSWNGDVLFETPRGQKWFRIAVSVAIDGNLNCFMIDITEQKQMETLLVQSTKLRDLTLSSAKIILWTFYDGEITNNSDVNAYHTINMNWDYINKNFDENSRQEFSEAIRNAFETNSNIDCILFYKGKWYSTRGGITEDKKTIVGVFFDVTELKQALIDLSKEQLRAQEANKTKTTFLANMSHEIRTPMNGIIGMLDILALHELTMEQRLLTDAIRSSSFDLMKHLSNTLNVSNIEQGTIDVEYSIFDVSQTLQPVAFAAASRAIQGKIDLKFEIDPTFPILIYGESQLFLQIVNNLISNALKFTKQGYVSVHVSWDKSEAIILEVADTGIGMSEEQKNIVFRRFSQADPSVARFYGGTGLGLSLVQDLIRTLNGKLNFDSELGKGTKFIVTIPCKAIACPYPIPFTGPTPMILMVTNKNSVNEFLQKFIEFYNFSIEYKETVEDVMTAFEAHKDKNTHEIVAVLVDIENSGSNSLKVKQYVQTEKPQVILCSISTPGNSCDFPRTLTKPLLPKPLRIFLDDLRFARKQNSDTDKPNIQLSETQAPSKILVVEDNKVNQFVMSKMLTKLNYEFRIAGNGEIALEKLDSEDFDLVFMDCQMPVMDGLEATRRIRASNKKYKSIPIVALTASAIEGDEETCRNAGMNGYLAKPVRIQQITDAIKKYTSE